MKISTLLAIGSLSFLGYWSYHNFFLVEKKELKIDIPVEKEEGEIIEIEEIIKPEEPLTPLQKLVIDHFQIAHR